MGSLPFKLSAKDVKSVLIGAVLAGFGAFFTYLIEWGTTLEFGEYTALAAAGLAVATNLVRKIFTDTRK